MAANPGFPLTLDVKGYVVLVLGGDEEAAEKTQRLLDAGAKVIVISPTLHERLKQLAASAKVIHRGRHFRETDLESAILVLNMIRGDRDFARSMFAKARERKVLVVVRRLSRSLHGEHAGGCRGRACARGDQHERHGAGAVRIHERRSRAHFGQ